MNVTPIASAKLRMSARYSSVSWVSPSACATAAFAHRPAPKSSTLASGARCFSDVRPISTNISRAMST